MQASALEVCLKGCSPGMVRLALNEIYLSALYLSICVPRKIVS
jgi:hypothetical protein